MLKVAAFLFILINLSFGQEAQNGASASGPEVITKEIEVVIGRDHEEKLGSYNFEPAANRFLFREEFLNYTYIPTSKTLFLRGLKPTPEKTDFLVFDNSGNTKIKFSVKVTATGQSKTITDLREFLGDVEGLEIGLKGDMVYVGGKIVVPSDIGKVVVVLEKYPDVLSLVELAPQTQIIIGKKMQEEIQNSGMRDVTVRVINGSFWLEGIVGSEAQKERAQTICEAYLPDNIENLARRTKSVQRSNKSFEVIRNFINVNRKSQPAPIPKLIKITAQFVELSKDYNRIFGFQWQPVLGGSGGEIAFGKTTSGGVTTRSNGTLSGVISNLFPKLESSKSAGYARVIESGVVIVEDKQNGKISKSSTKPFALGSGEFTRATESKAGFNLEVKPTILADEKIKLGIGISIAFSGTGDPPETTDNSIQTSLIVKSKESAVIGGISFNRSATDFDRNPPGGKTTTENGSPLFSFLKSKSYATIKNQFVIFVTPEIIESASTGADEIKRKFRKRQR